MIRSMSYSRYFKIPTPMLTGRATTPTSKSRDTTFELTAFAQQV